MVVMIKVEGSFGNKCLGQWRSALTERTAIGVVLLEV